MPPFWMTEISLFFMASPLVMAAAYWFQKLGSTFIARAARSFWNISENLRASPPSRAMGFSTDRRRPRLAGALFHMWVPMCTLRLPLVVKALPQMVQPKGFSPVWVRSWICRALAEEKVFPHD